MNILLNLVALFHFKRLSSTQKNSELCAWKLHYLTSSSKKSHFPRGLMATLSIALIHQWAHELEKGQTWLKGKRVWQKIALLNLWSQLNPKLNSCKFPLLLQAVIHSLSGSRVECFHPVGFWFKSVQWELTSALLKCPWARYCIPYQLHGWMLLCSWATLAYLCKEINISITIHEGSLWFISMLQSMPCEKMMEDTHSPEVIHFPVAIENICSLKIMFF